MDEILIHCLRVPAFVGVPETERATAQELEIDLALTPLHCFAALNDQLSNTVDYAAVAHRVTEIVAERPRCLIETLAADIVAALVSEFAVASARVEVRKFILPNTAHVAVRCCANTRRENR